ncbi:MAG: PmoA family protein [Bryobacteraceae bacterium]
MRTILILFAVVIPLAAQVNIKRGSDRILIEVNAKPFSDLFVGAEVTKPYLHPLRAATGTVVSRAFPMNLVEGEARDHPHQRGLWFTHGNVNGFDFWANEKSQTKATTGRVVLKRVGDIKSGKKAGSFEVWFDWVDPRDNVLLNEDRVTTVYADPLLRIVDFDILLTANTQVKFGDTKEGTFAMRLASALEEPRPKSIPTPVRTGRMTNAEGNSGEARVWGKRSAWVDYAGEINGEKVGVAIFDHPANPKHPTYWHSRSYGLFSANIFGEHDFYADKSRDGSVTLEKGQTMRFLYRVVIHPGDTASANIPTLYADYLKVKPRKLKP